MNLHEQYRPRQWSDLVGQDKAVATINGLRKRGLGGRAFFISGVSGSGKTTIARLIAADVADDWGITELDGGQVNTELLDQLQQDCQRRPLGKGVCVIINEAHGLRSAAIRRLLVVVESLPQWVTIVLTTTSDQQEKLFDDCDDAHPLLSRCTVLALSRRDLAKPFAERARMIAQAEGLDGQPMERYIKLMQSCRNNLRAALQAIEAGEMAQ